MVNREQATRTQTGTQTRTSRRTKSFDFDLLNKVRSYLIIYYLVLLLLFTSHIIYTAVLLLRPGWDSLIAVLFSDTNTLSLSLLLLNSQCVGVAKKVNNKTVLGLPWYLSQDEFQFGFSSINAFS